MRLLIGQRLLRGLYSFAMYLLAPLTLYHLVWRGLRQREYFRRWNERFGRFLAPDLSDTLWVHAVSVGEVNAAVPLVNALRARHPNRRVVVTTITPTGSARAKALWGEMVYHLYLPYDLPGAVRRFLDHIRPSLAIVMETEIWPNLYCHCADRGIPLMVANARLSERSLRGYLPLQPLVRLALSQVKLVAAQSRADAERYLRLGATPGQVCVAGNLKYDLRLPDGLEAQARRWRSRWGAQRPVWIAASTHEEEEDAVMAAHAALRERHPELLLLWAPRHPERFRAVELLAQETGLRTATRRVDGLPGMQTDCFVLDTLGELLTFYAAADLAFVGGSLQPIGGHNLLEPAALGVPAVVGPHTFNFVEVTGLLRKAQAIVQVADAEELVRALLELMQDAATRARMGAAGRAVVARERGALARTVELAEALLPAEAEAPAM